jgi:acetate kinase
VVFSGGIREHLPFIRKKICGGMEWCGLILDEGQNDSVVGTEAVFPPHKRESKHL